MKTIGRIFVAGLAAVLPLVITVWLLVWLLVGAESLLGGLIQKLLPEDLYVPGLGVAAAIALVFVVGLLTRAWLLARLFELGDSVMLRIPVLKTVYGASRDLMDFVAGRGERRFSQVVMVRTGPGDAELLGLVTREDLDELPAGIAGGAGRVAVYLPMSYQIGGYTLFVPRELVRPVDMSMEDAMRLALTAGMSVRKDSPGQRPAATE